MTTATIVVNVFVGASNLPIWVGQQEGFFDRLGLRVEVVETRNSREQMLGLIDGAWHVAHTSPDNIYAWEERAEACLVAWMGGFAGRISLYARAGITGLADLRGQHLAVDAADTGFAFILHAMMEQAGIARSEYELLPIGGTNLRFEALKDGQAAATLLNPPFDLMADRLGLRRLVSHDQVFRRYATHVATSRRHWLESNRSIAVAYLRSTVAALVWLADPGHRQAAAALLQIHLGVDSRMALEMYDHFMDPYQGFLPAAALDFKGLRTVLELRARMAGWPSVPALERYYDLATYEHALWVRS